MNSDDPYELVWSWLRILDKSSYYDLLGLSETADEAAVQEGFHRFSGSFHPDRHRGADDEIRVGVTRIYRRGAEAYGVLRNPAKRAAYNLALAQGALRLTKNPADSKKGKAGTSLEAVCKTAGGRLHASQAERAIGENNIDKARHLLMKALLAEDRNEELEARFQALIKIADQ